MMVEKKKTKSSVKWIKQRKEDNRSVASCKPSVNLARKKSCSFFLSL